MFNRYRYSNQPLGADAYSPQMEMVLDLIAGIRALNVPRAEDLPYWSSPPIQFVYESTATLALGTYTWTDTPSALTPDRPILNNALYFFRSISLVADVSELDFQLSISTTPQFQTYLVGDSRAPHFREPILMNKYYDQFAYRLWWMSAQGEDDQLLGTFRGVITQTANLIGKTSITLKAIISAQEVVDEHYVNLFKECYPGSER